MPVSFSATTNSIKGLLIGRINLLSEMLKPIPTGYPVGLKKIPGIKAVIFDVYGTLMISGSGDLGVAQKTDNESAFREALTAAGINQHLRKAYIRGSDLLLKKIQEHHERQRTNGTDYPEVDIRDIWNQVFDSLIKSSLIEDPVNDEQVIQAAIEYECRINPTWPMPDLEKVFDQLRQASFELGIVSNAQFYTPLLFEAYLEKNLIELGFREDLCYWSYEQQIAKPSTEFYKRIKKQLYDQYSISPPEVLYMGNDMLNDIRPAYNVGFKTALFAGDKRSLRLRKDHELCTHIEPDIVINQLSQLPECLEI